MGTIFFGDRAAVHREQIQAVFGKNLKQRIELPGILKPQSRLDREGSLHRLPQHPQQGIHPRQIAQQPTAGTLAVNDRRGTPEVEVYRSHGMPFQRLGGSRHGLKIVSNNLRNRWTTGGIFENRTEDVFLRDIMRRHAEELGEIQIRPAVFRHEPPERQVCDVLHGSQREDRRTSLEKAA